jgi:hypothetical protein
MRSRVRQATSARVGEHRRAAADGHAPPPGTGRERDAHQAGRGCRGTRWAHEGRAGRAGDRSGRPSDPATSEDVWPGHPAEAWTGRFPARLWEARVSQRGPLTRLERPRPRCVGKAAAALQVTADGESSDAWTREIQAEALPGHRSPLTATSHDGWCAPSLAGRRTARDAAGTGGAGGISGGALEAAAGEGS